MNKTANKNTESDLIKNMSSVNIKCEGKNIFCITIIGEIEGHVLSPTSNKTTKYEHVIPELLRVEEDDETEGLMIVLNTVGGDVEAGLAIAELIASMKKPTVSMVLGGGHSIGVPLAVSTKCSIIVPSAAMTVHPIRVSGPVITAPQSFNQMEKLQDRLADFVVKHSNISKEKFKDLLLNCGNISNDTGTVLYGEEAVKCGLIDKVGGISDAFNALKDMINNKKEQ